MKFRDTDSCSLEVTEIGGVFQGEANISIVEIERNITICNLIILNDDG